MSYDGWRVDRDTPRLSLCRERDSVSPLSHSSPFRVWPRQIIFLSFSTLPSFTYRNAASLGVRPTPDPCRQYVRRSSSPATLFEYRYLLTLRSSSIRRLGLSCAQGVTTHWKSCHILVITASLLAKRASLAETSSVYPKNRGHEHENQKMCLTKGRMVGFTFSFDSPLSVNTAKGLNTLASACETAKMPFEGVRIGVQSYETLVAAIRNREGFEDVLLGMHDLTDVIGLAKKAIRKHRGLVATAAMQEDLRELIIFYARTGAGAVTCTPFNELQLQDETQTRMGMFDKQLSLVIRMEAGMAKRSASASDFDSTVSASSRLRSSSNATSLSLVSSQSVSSSGTAIGAEVPPSIVLVEPVSPGTEVVVAAGQPLGRVDLLVACLPDNATIRQWCLRAINMCVSRVRSWVQGFLQEAKNVSC